MSLSKSVSVVPRSDQWDAMGEADRKNAVEALVGAILEEISTQGRQPDHWEATDLSAALTAITMGWHRAALGYAVMALQPPGVRAGSWGRVNTTPTLEQLREALEFVMGMPSRR
ncbi:hypothetical protein [Thiomonas sp. FB-6]|uniref:hypothetical protein n=1 Tax=Thiomonas sp. FB-6 TaxID=1158291 RepID=UPI000370EF43|nr:hypothetical protein [Thiomonas sp. FB-6]